MKYHDFYQCLSVKVAGKATIGPSITVDLRGRISMSKIMEKSTTRYVIFPVKIYGDNIRHLNILILDNKTKIIEKYEPFNHYFSLYQINSLLEPLLYKLMDQQKIYFLKYTSTLNNDTITNDKSCGLYCIKYAVARINQ